MPRINMAGIGILEESSVSASLFKHSGQNCTTHSKRSDNENQMLKLHAVCYYLMVDDGDEYLTERTNFVHEFMTFSFLSASALSNCSIHYHSIYSFSPL